MDREVPKNKKDHLVPACIIGNFSKYRDLQNGGRNNKVVVKIKGKDKTFETRAENTLYAKGEYDSVIDDLYGRRVTDGLWDEYESDLPVLVDAFESNSILPWEMYINTLVPYVASLFVRDQGYTQWVNSRMNNLMGVIATPETIQFNRQVFYSDTKLDILVYSIDILFDEEGRFILPDRGISFFDASYDYWRSDRFVAYSDKSLNGSKVWLTKSNGCLTPPSYLIPLSSKVIVKLTPREFLYASPKGDNIPVRYINTTNQIIKVEVSNFGTESFVYKKAVDYLNEGLAQGARRTMIAAKGETLNSLDFYDIPDEDFIGNILGMTALIRENRGDSAKEILNFYKNFKENAGYSMVAKNGECLLRVLNVRSRIKPTASTLNSHGIDNLYPFSMYRSFISNMIV